MAKIVPLVTEEQGLKILKLFRFNLGRRGYHHLSKHSKVICYTLYKTLVGEEIPKKS